MKNGIQCGGKGDGEGKIPPTLPLAPLMGKGADLPLTQESGPCTSPGQHSKTDPIEGVVGDLDPLLLYSVVGREEMPSQPPRHLTNVWQVEELTLWS